MSKDTQSLFGAKLVSDFRAIICNGVRFVLVRPLLKPCNTNGRGHLCRCLIYSFDDFPGVFLIVDFRIRKDPYPKRIFGKQIHCAPRDTAHEEPRLQLIVPLRVCSPVLPRILSDGFSIWGLVSRRLEVIGISPECCHFKLAFRDTSQGIYDHSRPVFLDRFLVHRLCVNVNSRHEAVVVHSNLERVRVIPPDNLFLCTLGLNSLLNFDHKHHRLLANVYVPLGLKSVAR
mmetsp:Transcript_16405/g.32078  ORF Transcript_16405/g.32078 Transcript_16405/m.32078 type:complete len:230 (+) Transcript_16405:136-825(+)